MSQAAWEAIKAESERIGLPENFSTDLDIDRRQLVDGEWGPVPGHFYYALRTNGTHLCKSLAEAETVDNTFNPYQVGGKIRWYRWDGEQLISYESYDAMETAVMDSVMNRPYNPAM